MIGLSSPDDAAVWRLDDERALVVTTDFFTPIVDDAYAYGAIAAANSLSDIYAMGGKPFLALNIAALPEDLPDELVSEIFRGGAEKAREAGVVIAGGHTVKDREPKYGLVGLGFANPDKMLSKSGFKAGDALVLTKPLGFGLTTTALKRNQADPADVEEAVTWMSRLNDVASQLAIDLGVVAGTDITGFGLLGHGSEIASSAGVGLRIEFNKIPLLGGTLKYAKMGAFARGLLDNQSFFGGHVQFEREFAEAEQMILFDPQTSGGLLLGMQKDKARMFVKQAEQLNLESWIIGEAHAGKGIRVQ